MPIRTEEHLANLLGRMFEAYANRVYNGAVSPFKQLLTEDTVEVVFTVGEGGIMNVRPLVPEVVVPVVMPEAEVPISEPEVSMGEPEILDQKALEDNKVIVKKVRKRKTE